MTDLRDVNLNRLVIFVQVVKAGSLTAAAARLGLAKTMVSTHMQRLESEVGVNLLTRTTRRLSLTEAGRRFYEAACDILHAAETAIDEISRDNIALRGTLRVSAPVDYGSLVVAPALVTLRNAHPQLRVELLCNDRYVDLIEENIDVAIRLGKLADSTYRSVKIGSYVRWPVATPAFVDAHGTPGKPEDLTRLPFIAASALPRPLTFDLVNASGTKKHVRCQSAFIANTAPACRAATLASGGFAVLTEFSIGTDIRSGQLVRLLPGWQTPEAEIRAVFPPSDRVPAKALALAQALQRAIGGASRSLPRA
ncbi:MAG TPA: LysR family transcriptional regulator [Paraburkholderia sp.]|jgi:DNA-binding transcriptional LysR family regulator|nr:LysR family transcriptional regulator [Paraburkholderia sp.]